MLKIGDKVFLNIQEAVGWLMANNALPFQSTAAYVADTEISLSTIVNPSPAKVRIGSIVFFADSKAATVMGVTSTSFTVGADHIDMGDIHHVTGDVSITGDLSVSNINVNDNANVGKLNSEKLNQKYEGAIKAELHVDEQGIAEAVNPGNTGRFETTRVIKPSEVKTEIYDTQANKRMSFRLPYYEASAGNHRLLTEEDLGSGGDETLVFTGRYLQPSLLSSDSYCRLLCKKNLLVVDCKGSFKNAVAGINDFAVIEMTSDEYNHVKSLVGFSSYEYGNTFATCYVNGGANYGLIYGQITFDNLNHKISIAIEKYTGDTINTNVSTRFDIDETFVGTAQ